MIACSQATKNVPVAKQEPKKIEAHGHTRVDPYYWLNQRENPEVLEYIKAENEYLETSLKHLKPFREKLFDEIKSRIKEDDSSVPYRLGPYFYYSRYEEGKEYPVHARKKDNLKNQEEIILDENLLAEGEDYLSVGTAEVSSNHRYLAYAVDTVGRRIYNIRIRDLQTGKDLPDSIENVTGNLEWAEDDKTLFYSKQDPTTLRSYQIWRHELGDDPKNDVLVFEEEDSTFSCYVGKTKSRAYMVIQSDQTLTSDYWILDTNKPTGEFEQFLPRERGHEYDFEHRGEHFYIATNKGGAKNFKLVRTPKNAREPKNWEEVIPHREDVLLEDFDLFTNFLVVEEREKGLTQIRIRDFRSSDEHYISFQDAAYTAETYNNFEMDTASLRFGYSSLTTPDSVYDYNMETRERELKKQEEVLGEFNPEHYESERLYIKARDGAEVPVSLVYKKGSKNSEGAPTVFYGYGSYGITVDPSFSSSRLSLLDRGFIFAIVHVRGSETLGRSWYENGRQLKKKNTFNDFIDATESLQKQGYADPKRSFAIGGSAGGLLMGAIVNMQPDLYKAVVADVPFVDVLTTMLDDSIPLTTGEYDEWGNPNKKEFYDYILSYSPYDNVSAQDYPAMLVISGLHDSQVQYFEPTKWVAKLRQIKTDTNPLYLFTHMEAGHGGASGRFERIKETALVYSFFIEQAGML